MFYVVVKSFRSNRAAESPQFWIMFRQMDDYVRSVRRWITANWAKILFDAFRPNIFVSENCFAFTWLKRGLKISFKSSAPSWTSSTYYLLNAASIIADLTWLFEKRIGSYVLRLSVSDRSIANRFSYNRCYWLFLATTCSCSAIKNDKARTQGWK